MPSGFRPHQGDYVNTPRGLFTASGTWYHVTEEKLKEYAGPVLEHVPLSVLVQQSDVWLRSAQTATIWLLPLILLVASPLPAILCALALYVGWKSLSPSFVLRRVILAFRWLDVVVVQGLYYVFVLSVLAGGDQYTEVWIGLAGFILLRWGLLDWATRPLVRLLRSSLYPMPVPDYTLRSLIIRTALRYDVSLPQLDQLKRSFHNRSSS